ncbi:MAG: hypothetical protein BJ554DRAFT_3187 [Olpidium bornovanus]|uniref:Uncharacterized protein n=1 Tax=Olpidium bornovanus TaxID=278681 RepID=A0A8H7ZPV6_9FUNG|nr:MAG: hypothetical protein BJ554DRAFT_3187 [Olpidium bornovanus]
MLERCEHENGSLSHPRLGLEEDVHAQNGLRDALLLNCNCQRARSKPRLETSAKLTAAQGTETSTEARKPPRPVGKRDLRSGARNHSPRSPGGVPAKQQEVSEARRVHANVASLVVLIDFPVAFCRIFRGSHGQAVVPDGRNTVGMLEGIHFLVVVDEVIAVVCHCFTLRLQRIDRQGKDGLAAKARFSKDVAFFHI